MLRPGQGLVQLCQIAFRKVSQVVINLLVSEAVKRKYSFQQPSKSKQAYCNKID
jgi:hypothetical protein